MPMPIIMIRNNNIVARRPRYEDLKELVYILIQLIPIGSTTTYGNIAKVLNISPRLVGKILRENRHPIKIPCHRVVSTKGLGGYTLGGKRALDIKRKLLELESGGTLRKFDLYAYLVIGST